MNIAGNQRICIVAGTIPPMFGGAGLRAYRYAKRLHKKNRLAFILSIQPRKKSGKKWLSYSSKENIPEEKIFRIPIYQYDVEFGNRNPVRYFWIEYVKLFFCVTWCLFRHRKSFDVIHCFGTGGTLISVYAIAIGKLLGKKSVAEMTLLGQDDPLSILRNDCSRIKGRLRYWLFSKADIVVSLSPALSSAYKTSGLSMKKLMEIANPVDTAIFRRPTERGKTHLRKKFGIKDKQPVLLCVGSIIKRKGIDFLIDSFVKILDKYSDALLLLVGPDTYKGEFTIEMKRCIETQGIAGQVVFTGLVDNVHEYMQASDIFVFASQREGFPNVLGEAMAVGLPIVSTNIAGITATIIQDSHNGFIVNRDCSEFASAVIRLLDDQDLYQAFSRNAIQKIDDCFSIEIIDNQYEKTYM